MIEIFKNMTFYELIAIILQSIVFFESITAVYKRIKKNEMILDKIIIIIFAIGMVLSRFEIGRQRILIEDQKNEIKQLKEIYV